MFFDYYDDDDDDEYEYGDDNEYDEDSDDKCDDNNSADGSSESNMDYSDIIAKRERIRYEKEKRIKKEEKKARRRRMWRTILRKKQEIGISSLQCREIHCEKLIRMLKERDFYNIQTIILEDLTIDNISREGIVDNISINGENVFDSVTRFPFGAKIVIVYHMLQRISPPITLREARRKNEAEVVYRFSNAGFMNITKEAIPDLRKGWIVKIGTVENITIDGRSDFTRKEKFRPDAQIKISYHTFGEMWVKFH